MELRQPPSAPSDITYGGYLQLDRLLDCQMPLSDTHDELLFIVLSSADKAAACRVHEGA